MGNVDLAQWQALWSALGVDPPAAHWFDELQQSYGEPHRTYHTLQHINESSAHFQRVSDLATDPPTVVAALWFHDVIYEPKQHDNEAASAAWARLAASGRGCHAHRADPGVDPLHHAQSDSPDGRCGAAGRYRIARFC